MDDLSGTILAGRYLLRSLLSRGGRAAVYEAVDQHHDRACAIKILTSTTSDEHDTRQASREAAALSTIPMDHTAKLLGQGRTADGRAFLVLERLDGMDLRGVLVRDIRLPWQTACTWLAAVCESMTAVHRAGVVHGDLKPENIFICSESSTAPRVKLLDFGSARRLVGDDGDASERSGTPEYMAPEWERQRMITAATDIYACGIMLYECVTGRLPFRGASDHETLSLARHGDPPALPDVVPWLDLPLDLEPLIRRAMHPNPERRHPSFEALAQALHALLRAARHVPATRLPTRHVHPRRRLGPRWLAIPLLAVTTIGLWYLTRSAPPPPTRSITKTLAPGPKRLSVVWHNAARGQIQVWLMQGLTFHQTFRLGGSTDTGWNVVQTGDFNGDSDTDILWYHAMAHSAALWYVNLGARRPVLNSGPGFQGYGNRHWNLVNAGDFDGNGEADLLWQHAPSGRVAICSMLSGVQDNCTELDGPDDDPEFRVRGVADLDGDGHADIVWQHALEHWVSVWYMRGPVPLRRSDTDIPGMSNWMIAHIGRFTYGDTLDLLLVDSATGMAAIHPLSSDTPPRIIGFTLPGWHAAAVEDFDGDDLSDIVWQADVVMPRAQMNVWLMRGEAPPTMKDFVAPLPPPWHVVAAPRF